MDSDTDIESLMGGTWYVEVFLIYGWIPGNN